MLSRIYVFFVFEEERDKKNSIENNFYFVSYKLILKKLLSKIYILFSFFQEQLFKKTFHQDSSRINQPSRFDDGDYGVQLKIKMLKKKEIAKNITQMTTTQQTTKQTTVAQDNLTQKIKIELKVGHECTPDGKKCTDFEAEFTDREDHNIQVVDEMFVNTDNEITSIQVMLLV